MQLQQQKQSGAHRFRNILLSSSLKAGIDAEVQRAQMRAEAGASSSSISTIASVENLRNKLMSVYIFYEGLHCINADEPCYPWWKAIGILFSASPSFELLPYLRRMARKYLTLLATSTDVERLFSEVNLVSTPHRGNLSSDNTEALVLINKNRELLSQLFNYDFLHQPLFAKDLVSPLPSSEEASSTSACATRLQPPKRPRQTLLPFASLTASPVQQLAPYAGTPGRTAVDTAASSTGDADDEVNEFVLVGDEENRNVRPHVAENDNSGVDVILIDTDSGRGRGDEPPDDDNRIDDNFDIESKNYLS